jgi:cytochrome c oxidase cbb3-type subunit 1
MGATWRGVMQSVVNAWFTNNLLGLWLAPVGLAAIYYFIPKLSGRPLYSQYIAALGFWTLAIFTNWTGLTRLIGGPVPAWMPSASIAASALMIVPVLCVALNWHLTLAGRRAEVGRDVTGRFIVFGALAYLLWSLLNIVSGLRDVSALTQFTFFGAARNALGLLGFFTMTMFGAIYYIVPRLTGVDWPSGKLIRSHATCSTGGILISVGALFIAGLIQGAKGRSVQMDFLAVIKSTLPWVGLATLGLLLFLIGQLAFLKNFLTLLHIQVAPHRKSAIQFVCGAEAARPGGNV